jgi:hypothetical protein
LKPRVIALTVLLAAALAAVAWQARARWTEARETRAKTIDVKVKPAPVPPLVPVPKPEGATPAKYADVATKNLFAKDRNPNVIIDPPKIEPPKKMPPLPVVYGVLGLPSGTRAMMSERSGEPSKAVRAGDTIGEFKIESLDAQNVVFDWDGKQFPKKIEDLIDRSAGIDPASAASTPVAQRAVAAAPAPAQPQGTPKGPGAEFATAAGTSQRACVPGDSTPANTVVDGYRKNVVPTPFGNVCTWIKVQ